MVVRVKEKSRHRIVAGCGGLSQPEMGGVLFLSVGLKPRDYKRKADRSRVNREIHPRFCGGSVAKVLRSTRPFPHN